MPRHFCPDRRPSIIIIKLGCYNTSYHIGISDDNNISCYKMKSENAKIVAKQHAVVKRYANRQLT
jgi:hypothetical protein